MSTTVTAFIRFLSLLSDPLCPLLSLSLLFFSSSLSFLFHFSSSHRLWVGVVGDVREVWKGLRERSGRALAVGGAAGSGDVQSHHLPPPSAHSFSRKIRRILRRSEIRTRTYWGVGASWRPSIHLCVPMSPFIPYFHCPDGRVSWLRSGESADSLWREIACVSKVHFISFLSRARALCEDWAEGVCGRSRGDLEDPSRWDVGEVITHILVGAAVGTRGKERVGEEQVREREKGRI